MYANLEGRSRWRLSLNTGRLTILSLRHTILLVCHPSCWRQWKNWWTGLSGMRFWGCVPYIYTCLPTNQVSSLKPHCNIWSHIAHLRQQCHNSKFVIFQERLLKVLKCCNFLQVQRRHNCSLAASFANCVMILYLLKVHLQTFLFIPITQKCRIWVVTLLSQMSDILRKQWITWKLHLELS